MRHCNNLKYWERQVCANSVDPDQMPQNVASDQGLYCFHLIQQGMSMGSRMDSLKFEINVVGS